MSTPPFIRTPDSNFENLADYPYAPNYFDIEGLRMHYIDEGPRDAPVILMMHGMPTWSYLYRNIIPSMLAAGYRCVAPDHIGFGKSDKVIDPAWYNIAQHVANTKKLIQHLDLTNVTAMVQDWGGPTGLAQVASMPERFVRLCIMNTWLHHADFEYSPGVRQWIEQNSPGGLFVTTIPSPFSWGGLMAMATDRITPQDSIFKVLHGETPTYEGVAGDVKRGYDAPFEGLGEAGVTGPRRFPLSIPHNDPVLGDAVNQEKNFSIINALPIPIHFLWGPNDDVFTLEWGMKWHSLIPHSTFEEIAGARHFLQDTHGPEIAARLLAHMQ
jgi:haloalkane dehalogenase